MKEPYQGIASHIAYNGFWEHNNQTYKVRWYGGPKGGVVIIEEPIITRRFFRTPSKLEVAEAKRRMIDKLCALHKQKERATTLILEGWRECKLDPNITTLDLLDRFWADLDAWVEEYRKDCEAVAFAGVVRRVIPKIL